MSGPFSDPIVQGMLYGKARQLAGNNRALSNTLAQANANISEAQEIIDEQHAELIRLRSHIQQMEWVREAENEALGTVTDAWRKEHHVSHMHDFIGKWSDGEGMRRNSRIWIDAFLTCARKIGVRNPEEWIAL